MSSRKRKHQTRSRYENTSTSANESYASSSASGSYYAHDHNDSDPAAPDPALFVQVHEADVIRGPRAHVSALSLEVRRRVDSDGVDVGSGLMRWGEDLKEMRRGGDGFLGDDEDGDGGGFGGVDDSRDSEGIWVDRYDARLLLDPPSSSSLGLAPSTFTSSATAPPDSPTGWSDLPSDTEDTFFFTPDEAEDYRRDKRRRVMERAREERLKARMIEDGEDGAGEGEDAWGESDEEPEEPQKEIMRRTAKSILSSPNPAQLEMRILANHGGDKRFAFLRGRWSRTWKTIKARIRVEREEEEKKKAQEEEEEKKRAGLGGLADYGDSDAEEDEAGEEEDTGIEKTRPDEEENARKEAAIQVKRAKLEAWRAQRKLAGT